MIGECTLYNTQIKTNSTLFGVLSYSLSINQRLFSILLVCLYIWFLEIQIHYLNLEIIFSWSSNVKGRPRKYLLFLVFRSWKLNFWRRSSRVLSKKDALYYFTLHLFLTIFPRFEFFYKFLQCDNGNFKTLFYSCVIIEKS